jgi:hypothetical protein
LAGCSGASGFASITRLRLQERRGLPLLSAGNQSAANLPPSTTKVVPLMNLASSEARKQIASRYVFWFTDGTFIFSVPSLTFGFAHSMGVFTAPGATLLMRSLDIGSSWLTAV